MSRRAHGAHHRAPFEGNYCIVSGVWNPILDAGGSPDGFFRRLERFVAARTGVEPRCWHEPDYSWQEAPDAPLQGKTSSWVVDHWGDGPINSPWVVVSNSNGVVCGLNAVGPGFYCGSEVERQSKCICQGLCRNLRMIGQLRRA